MLNMIRARRFWIPLALAALLLLGHAALINHLVDDAYITFRYAANLLAGHGLVFNPGERVEGYTNLLWVLLSVPGLALGVEPLLWARILGIGAGIATLGTAALLHRQAGGRCPALPMLLLAASSAFATWCWAGLETSLYAFWITTALLLRARWSAAVAEVPPGPPGASVAAPAVGDDTTGAGSVPGAPAGAAGRLSAALGVILALAFMTRPDGALFAALLLTPARLPDGRWRVPGWGVIWAGLVGLAVEGGRLLYYGDWVPNTFHAKTGASWDVLLRGADYLRGSAVAGGGGLLLLAIVGVAVSRWGLLAPGGDGGEASRGAAPAPSHLPRALPALLLYLLYVAAVGGDSMLLERFVVPVLPLLLVWVALGLEFCATALATAIRRARQPAPTEAAGTARAGATLARAAATPRYWLLLLLIAALAAETQVADPALRREVERRRAAVEDWLTIGRWMGANLPADTRIAVGAAGAMPYASGLETIDYFGLNDRWIARAPVPDLGRAPAGHERGDGAYVLRRRPDLIIGHVRLEEQAMSAPMLRRMMSSTRAERLILEQPEFARLYEPTSVRIGAKWLTCYKRKAWSATAESPAAADPTPEPTSG